MKKRMRFVRLFVFRSQLRREISPKQFIACTPMRRKRSCEEMETYENAAHQGY